MRFICFYYTFKVKRHLNAQADHVAKANVERVSVPQAPQGVEDGTARFSFDAQTFILRVESRDLNCSPLWQVFV
jgi:hypothetical protein